MSTEQPANSLLTPLVAFGGTLVGVFVLFYGNSALAPVLAGGAGAVCRSPDCALGVGIWLIFGGFVVLCASVIASVLVALRHREPTRRAAMRRGLLVTLWCSAAYLVESAVVWILV